MISLFEVWEYRHGRHPRFRYRVETEKEAVDKFLERKVFGGDSFQKYLLEELKYNSIKICIKDAGKKGTKQKPNYPAILDVDLKNTQQLA